MLEYSDTPALQDLVDRDPVANVFIAAHLEAVTSAAPTAGGAKILGSFRSGELIAACWMGANVVPVAVTAEIGADMGRWLAKSGRRFSSIFGPAEGVMAIWSRLQWSSPRPFDVRPNQPLMELRTVPRVAPNPGLRFTEPDELDVLLPASVAMFEEEVGYSPLTGGQEQYRQRVRNLIRRRHSLLDLDAAGQVVFKAELGTVTRQVTQIQGVWMNPQYRGLGLSEGYMAAVAVAAQRIAPVTSLYVNSYNARAMAAYSAVGFTQVGTFATVLF